MNSQFRKPLPGSHLDFFDTREAIESIKPGAYDTLPYTSRVLAENLVRRCPPENLTACLTQIVERKRDLDFPWFPARVVCHDILGQTALVDLAGLRDAIARRDNIDIFECGFSPVNKMESVFVAAFFNGAVFLKCILLKTGMLHCQRMVHD